MSKIKEESAASTGAYRPCKTTAFALDASNFAVTWDGVQVGLIAGKPVMDADFTTPEHLRTWCDLNLTFIASIYSRLLGFREACATAGMLEDKPASTEVV